MPVTHEEIIGYIWCDHQEDVHDDPDQGVICSLGHWHRYSLNGCIKCPSPHGPIDIRRTDYPRDADA